MKGCSKAQRAKADRSFALNNVLLTLKFRSEQKQLLANKSQCQKEVMIFLILIRVQTKNENTQIMTNK